MEVNWSFIDYVWGVVDSVPITDFPDIRNRTAIHSNNGSCMVIPREGDTVSRKTDPQYYLTHTGVFQVRLYVQMSEIPRGESGRLDKEKAGPEKVIEVRIFMTPSAEYLLS